MRFVITWHCSSQPNHNLYRVSERSRNRNTHQAAHGLLSSASRSASKMT